MDILRFIEHKTYLSKERLRELLRDPNLKILIYFWLIKIGFFVLRLLFLILSHQGIFVTIVSIAAGGLRPNGYLPNVCPKTVTVLVLNLDLNPNQKSHSSILTQGTLILVDELNEKRSVNVYWRNLGLNKIKPLRSSPPVHRRNRASSTNILDLDSLATILIQSYMLKEAMESMGERMFGDGMSIWWAKAIPETTHARISRALQPIGFWGDYLKETKVEDSISQSDNETLSDTETEENENFPLSPVVDRPEVQNSIAQSSNEQSAFVSDVADEISLLKEYIIAKDDCINCLNQTVSRQIDQISSLDTENSEKSHKMIFLEADILNKQFEIDCLNQRILRQEEQILSLNDANLREFHDREFLSEKINFLESQNRNAEMIFNALNEQSKKIKDLYDKQNLELKKIKDGLAQLIDMVETYGLLLKLSFYVNKLKRLLNQEDSSK